jgi:hypothetical protein
MTAQYNNGLSFQGGGFGRSMQQTAWIVHYSFNLFVLVNPEAELQGYRRVIEECFLNWVSI